MDDQNQLKVVPHAILLIESLPHGRYAHLLLLENLLMNLLLWSHVHLRVPKIRGQGFNNSDLLLVK